ncbi:BspA family leucine-rich repeat surface protein [Metamycoplasma alkalescens]|uniref:Uncharacterized protein DUF285 n=3 Tax=Metamycoplasma alkalescens TaxID=45363 RepID=A0A318UIF0_9BACT|nr:BspA family leucine-rich repeat surface protein [Metamycoplasma alkalescens]PYF42556.1 uncharacterized protein DUF285 [Metamycoplasma alkalescens]
MFPVHKPNEEKNVNPEIKPGIVPNKNENKPNSNQNQNENNLNPIANKDNNEIPSNSSPNEDLVHQIQLLNLVQGIWLDKFFNKINEGKKYQDILNDFQKEIGKELQKFEINVEIKLIENSEQFKKAEDDFETIGISILEQKFDFNLGKLIKNFKPLNSDDMIKKITEIWKKKFQNKIYESWPKNLVESKLKKELKQYNFDLKTLSFNKTSSNNIIHITIKNINKDISLHFRNLIEVKNKPTRYVVGYNKIKPEENSKNDIQFEIWNPIWKETYATDLSDLKATEILEIGYYKDKDGVFRVPRMPKNIEWITDVLPPQITSLENMFYGVRSKQIRGLQKWDTSNIQNMSGLFRTTNYFNEDISRWDTSNVLTMQSIFENAFLFNQDLKNWDTSNLINMNKMFFNAFAFNQDLSNWNVASVLQKDDFDTHANPNWNQDKKPQFKIK